MDENKLKRNNFYDGIFSSSEKSSENNSFNFDLFNTDHLMSGMDSFNEFYND